MVISETTLRGSSLAEAARKGDRLALARLLTQVENETPTGQSALDALFPFTGKAHLVGITGSPGTGKSSLVNQLAKAYRKREPAGQARVAVVAIDPTSPFSGGAVLGDRVRMRDLIGDPGIFIRSMATRGALGGLARSTAGVVQVFDAAGYDPILIETVGAGQSEVDIARLAHTTVVVEAPGLGDEIQSIKAGILEIADVLVVNKSDRPGAEIALRILHNMLELAHPGDDLYHHPHCPEPAIPLPRTQDWNAAPAESFWTPPVLSTTAIHSQGIDALVEAILAHAEYLRRSGEWQRRDHERIRSELSARIMAELVSHWRAGLSEERYQWIFQQLTERRISPQQAVQMLLDGGR
ncbi:MAG: methylmalonyl Co-A mutase-associated GTPase MeaB [Anaerolineaceae bacterium]|nr:methylmalonyl Co-A mutase-associated GTPase MeaB [Anaerolineaceae bacterium]